MRSSKDGGLPFPHLSVAVKLMCTGYRVIWVAYVFNKIVWARNGSGSEKLATLSEILQLFGLCIAGFKSIKCNNRMQQNIQHPTQENKLLLIFKFLFLFPSFQNFVSILYDKIIIFYSVSENT